MYWFVVVICVFGGFIYKKFGYHMELIKLSTIICNYIYFPGNALF